MIDWSLTVPQGDETVFQKLGTAPIEFRVDQAVYDPEGDRIEYLWYWRYEFEDLLVPMVGSSTHMMENRCTSDNAFKESGWIIVEVVVSDGELRWVGGTEPENPVATSPDDEGNPRPVVKRTWTVFLTGDCE